MKILKWKIPDEAATPPSLSVTANVKLLEVQGHKLIFQVEAWDGVDRICLGTHQRIVIDARRLRGKVAHKAARFRGED